MQARTASASNRLCQRLALQHPIVVAPMVGWSTPELVAAGTNAGALGMFGAGGTPKDGLSKALQRIGTLIREPDACFGVNLFVPSGFLADSQHWSPAQAIAVQEANVRHRAMLTDLGAEIPSTPQYSSLESMQQIFDGQVDSIVENNVKVASFHFGWPTTMNYDKLKAAGTFLIGNATNEAEGQELARLGADAIIAQGSEAGGHRGTFLEPDKWRTNAMVSTLSLTRSLAATTGLPVISAGGLMDGTDVMAALEAGASAAQMGTAFLVSNESNTSTLHREALRNDLGDTVVTQCFTGKPAQAIPNAWATEMHELQERLPNCFNSMDLGRVVNGAALKSNRADVLYMWAGKEYRRSRDSIGAAQLIEAIVAEMHDAPSVAA